MHDLDLYLDLIPHQNNMQRFPVAAEEYHVWYWKILRGYELEEQTSTENSEKKPAHMYLKTTHMEKSSN